MATRTLKVLTYNCGLPTVLGLSVVVPYVSERARAIPGVIRKCGADIVLLQEVYGRKRREEIHRQLRDIYPFVAYSPQRWGARILLDAGLMTLSRFPIVEQNYTSFTENLWDDAVTRRGVLMACMRVQGIGLVAISNTHTMAGGLYRDPQDSIIEMLRQKQLDQMMDLMSSVRADLVLMGGDFNAGPQASCNNWNSLLRRGWRSGFSPKQIKGFRRVTWCPKNPLNAGGPHAKKGGFYCPPQLIDWILYQQGGLVRSASARVVCRTPCVAVKGGRLLVTPSDHHGILTRFTFAS